MFHFSLVVIGCRPKFEARTERRLQTPRSRRSRFLFRLDLRLGTSSASERSRGFGLIPSQRFSASLNRDAIYVFSESVKAGFCEKHLFYLDSGPRVMYCCVRLD
jgi:hypothetical protein